MEEIKLTLPYVENIQICIKNKQVVEFANRQLKNYVTAINHANNSEEHDYAMIVDNMLIVNKFKDFVSYNVVLGRQYKVENNIFYSQHFIYQIKNNKLKTVQRIQQKSLLNLQKILEG